MENYFLLLTTFISLFLTNNCSTVIQGEIISQGNPTGNFSLHPTACLSRQRMQFYGIILSQNENEGIILTGIIDPIRGKIIKLKSPNSCQSEDQDDCKEIFISKESCSVYKLTLEPTNVMINRIRALRG